METTTVRERLQDKMAELTHSERNLASVLFKDYPLAGLKTITKLAEDADVSTPTVIRMARKLGFDGFPALQEALRDEMASQIKTPISKGGATRSTQSENILTQFAEAITSNLKHTLERLDVDDFLQLAAELSDLNASIYIAGGRITRSNADYFYNHLQIIRPKVNLLSHSPNVWPQYLLDMDHTSALIIFDIRRYETDLLKLARLAQERGVKIVLFTDQWGSPIETLATYCFHSFVEVPSSWDSTLGIMFILEALIAEIQNKNWSESQERISELESMFHKTKLFRNLK